MEITLLILGLLATVLLTYLLVGSSHNHSKCKYEKPDDWEV